METIQLSRVQVYMQKQVWRIGQILVCLCVWASPFSLWNHMLSTHRISMCPCISELRCSVRQREGKDGMALGWKCKPNSSISPSKHTTLCRVSSSQLWAASALDKHNTTTSQCHLISGLAFWILFVAHIKGMAFQNQLPVKYSTRFRPHPPPAKHMPTCLIWSILVLPWWPWGPVQCWC